jgi:cytochrome P450 family 144
MRVLHDPLEFFGERSIQDPYPLYERLREGGPLHRVGESMFYVVARWDAVEEVVARTEDFSSNLTATMVYRPDGTVTSFDMEGLDGASHVLATADDPAHATHRKVLVPALAVKRIRAAESFAADTAEQLWRDGVVDGRIEWMGAMANRLPMMVVAGLIGVPVEDTDKLVEWTDGATQMLAGVVSAEGLDAAGFATLQLVGYIIEHFGRATADPQDNLLGDLARAVAAGDLDALTAQLMMVTLFSAGGESTASLIGSAAAILADRPDVATQLRENPDLLDRFIEETLRYEPPFRGHYRHVRVDTTLCGTAVAADSHLVLLWGAVNRDPARFEAPNEFRLDRPHPKGHMAFGKGAHFCVGAALARMEARIVLRKLLDSTSHIEAVDTGPWLPSVLVRRRERLELALRA